MADNTNSNVDAFKDLFNNTSTEDSIPNDVSTIIAELRTLNANALKFYNNFDKFYSDFIKSDTKGNHPDNGKSQSNSKTARKESTRSQDSGFNAKSISRNAGSIGKQFTDGLTSTLQEALFGSNLKSQLQGSLNNFASSLGVNIQDIPNELGKRLGQQILGKFSGSKIGQKLKNNFDRNINEAFSQFNGAVNNVKWSKDSATSVPSGTSSSSGGSSVSDAVGDVVGGAVTDTATKLASKSATDTAATAVANTATNAVGTFSKALMSGAAAIGPVIVAMIALEAITEAFGPVLEALKGLFEVINRIFYRGQEEREKRAENAQKRLEADVETLVKYPFEILSKAAEEWYSVWDSELRKIAGTQGYSKDDVYDLAGAYAERLRDEGLTSVVSSADIVSNLSKVLDSGLSGAAAEEFAYMASILNSAIPTQDFFEYADTYVSLAAQAQAQGASQQESLDYANQQLELFASNILYASRQLTGGFTTGLKDASSLFQQATQIAQASKTGDPSQIAGVLTSVAAITGSIAPDLATSMTELVLKAATGGNSSELVALRSLAGVNASNTEFLRAFAENPQQIFSTLFTNLADMQNMSPDAYMEVAEGLSDIFGVSMDAFSRIDFNYLANAIQNMSVNTASLEENIAHLASGETTTTAEQLKMQQVNKYILDNGLSYVLDNEAARAIQQHMWDEQMANELMENTFAVELASESLGVLTAIMNFVDMIVSILNPFSFLGKIFNLAQTQNEAIAQVIDKQQVLELGKVGSGNSNDLRNLMTINQDLGLVPPLATLMGGQSIYSSVAGKSYSGYYHQTSIVNDLISHISDAITGTGFTSRGNSYTWGNVSKSLVASAFGSGSATGSAYIGNTSYQTLSAEEAQKASAENLLQKLTDKEFVESFASEGKSYEEWIKEGSKRYGISDLSKVLETAGRTESELETLYRQYETQSGAQKQAERLIKEENFWITTNENQAIQHDLTTQGNELLQKLLDTTTIFKDLFDSYIVKHEVYDASYKYEDVERIRNQESSGESDAIYALASALTQNTVDLRDPTVQTNAILAQILIVVQAIMQQNNTTGKLTLPDAISAMATGMFKLE